MIQAAQEIQSRYGCEVVYGHDGHQSLSAELRAKILLDYCLDSSIDMLWAVRGGEGSADVIPYLQAHAEALSCVAPKLCLGFSDITAMLLYWSTHWQWPVVHGPCVNAWVQGQLNTPTLCAVDNLLLNKEQAICIDDLRPMNDAARQLNTLTAPLIAGNLTLMNISVKEPWECATAGHVVIVEEVNEKPHAVRRTLNYLRRVGVLDQPAALILSGLTTHLCPKADAGMFESMHTVLVEVASQCEHPVFCSSAIGHGAMNLPVPFGQVATLSCTTEQGAALSYTLPSLLGCDTARA